MARKRNLNLSAYGISKSRQNELKYFCYQYNEWKKELDILRMDVGPGGMNYDGMPHGSSTASSTEEKAIRMVELESKIESVHIAAKRAAGDLWEYVVEYVTSEHINFQRFKLKIPCSDRTFFYYRKKFFYYLSQKKRGV